MVQQYAAFVLTAAGMSFCWGLAIDCFKTDDGDRIVNLFLGSIFMGLAIALQVGCAISLDAIWGTFIRGLK